jgi:hypothetical protein
MMVHTTAHSVPPSRLVPNSLKVSIMAQPARR